MGNMMADQFTLASFSRPPLAMYTSNLILTQRRVAALKVGIGSTILAPLTSASLRQTTPTFPTSHRAHPQSVANNRLKVEEEQELMGKNGAEERQPGSRRPRVAAAYGRRAFFKAGAALTVFAGSAFVPAATRSQTEDRPPHLG